MFQKNTKTITNTKIIQFFVLIVIVVTMTYLMNSRYNETLKDSKDQLNEKIISYYFDIFEHTSKKFLEDTNYNFVDTIINNENIRKKSEEILSIIRISVIQNLFVITQDSDKSYYFLLDSETDVQMQSKLFEPFSPQSDIWDICYKTQKPQIYKHKNNKNLWVSIAYPIIENGVTVGLIAADISYILDSSIETSLGNFKSLFLNILLIGLSSFIFLYISTLYFRRKFHDGYIDSLTEVYNRRYLNDVLVKHLSRSYQVYMIDIDHFKKVNDVFGHDAGDYVLKEVAQCIQSLMRDDDVLVRLGGEEFLVYTVGLSPKQSSTFAARIRTKVAQKTIIYKSNTCSVTVSIGINQFAKNIYPFKDMLKYADDALYEAKSSGRNCVKVFDS